MDFNEKVAIVTGAGSGIGQATAKLLSKDKAKLVLVDINEESVKETLEMCKNFGSEAIIVIADVSKDEDVKNIIKKCIDRFGKLDILINNAGILRTETLLSGNMMKTYDEVMNVNLRSAVLMTNFAVPHLIQFKGCIVNTSSITSVYPRPGPNYPAYTIAKSGLDAFTRISAASLSKSGVRVNAVNPGPVDTKLCIHAGLPNLIKAMDKETALGTLIEKEEVADLIIYLVSNKAKNITGACFVIDGGMSVI